MIRYTMDLHGPLVEYHHAILRAAQRMMELYPPHGITPITEDDEWFNRLYNPAPGAEVPGRSIVHPSVFDVHFGPEQLKVQGAYKGEIFRRLRELYMAFRFGGWRRERHRDQNQ